eukprot:107421-Chlamydomonas_euryale.AAC.11
MPPYDTKLGTSVQVCRGDCARSSGSDIFPHLKALLAPHNGFVLLSSETAGTCQREKELRRANINVPFTDGAPCRIDHRHQPCESYQILEAPWFPYTSSPARDRVTRNGECRMCWASGKVQPGDVWDAVLANRLRLTPGHPCLSGHSPSTMICTRTSTSAAHRSNSITEGAHGAGSESE